MPLPRPPHPDGPVGQAESAPICRETRERRKPHVIWDIFSREANNSRTLGPVWGRGYYYIIILLILINRLVA